MTSEDTRTRILDAAGPIFAEKGYAAATVREICQEAGVNLASVNYYFGGKENLYREALKLAHPAKFRAQGNFQWPERTRPEAKLKDFIRFLLTQVLRVEASPWQERLFIREIMNPTPACKELLRERFRSGFDQLQEILEEILPPDTPVYKRHQIGLSVIGQCVYYRPARKILPLILGDEELAKYYGIDQLAEHICEVSLAALGLGPPLARQWRPGTGGGQSSPGGGERSTISADKSGQGVK